MSVPLPWTQMPRTAVIVGMEMAAGDACEQQIAGAGAWDKGRSARLGVTGLVTTGPLAHALFRQLEIISPGTSSRAVFSKVLMNAAFMPVMISATLSTAWILEGRRRTEIFTLLKRELGAAVLEQFAERLELADVRARRDALEEPHGERVARARDDAVEEPHAVVAGGQVAVEVPPEVVVVLVGLGLGLEDR